jgi:hypothetical protein
MIVGAPKSAPGTSRQFTLTHQFGRNRRHSGHAAKPCGASGDVNDPQRTCSRSAGGITLCNRSDHVEELLEHRRGIASSPSKPKKGFRSAAL